MEKSILKDHVQKLKSGEIVIVTETNPEKENDNQLNVAMAILASAPLKKTVETLQRQATAKDGPGILAIGEIRGETASDLDKAFADVCYTQDEEKEASEMMRAEPGTRFNYSREELAIIKKRADGVKNGNQSGTAGVKAMSLAMQDVLKERFLAYSEKGIDGLAPYEAGGSKQIQPSEELIFATESLTELKKRHPNYYACLRFYPKEQDPKLVNQFFWAKQTEAGRPIFMLKHWLLDVGADYAIITERRFYLNHSLNSLQVVIGCLPNGESTLVVLLNQAFTEKVNINIGKSIAKKIGYHQVEKNIRPIFENLRNALKP